jgi:hypothetical protein
MSGIFISYRREDSAGWTGRLAETLKEEFGAESIFMDVDGIKPGLEFPVALQQALESCDVLLAVIGPEWATVTDPSGKPRLEDPFDWVRIEIAAALKRKIRVIPVLVGGASVPTMDFLPDELDPLAHRQAHELTDKRWKYDVEELTKTFPTALQKPWLLPNIQLWQSTPVMIGALLIAVTLTVWVFTSIYSPDSIQADTPNTTPPGIPTVGPPQEISAKIEESAAPQLVHLRVGQEVRLKDHVTTCVYKVLAAQMDRSRPDLSLLRMIVRVTNEGSMTTNFGDNNFRLLIDNVPRAPTSNLNDLVDAHSAKEGTIVFAVPVNATRFVLQFLMGEEKATFPL